MSKYDNKVKVTAGCFGTLAVMIGLYQGITLANAIPMEPYIHGLIGGIIPVFFGMFGAFLLMFAYSEAE